MRTVLAHSIAACLLLAAAGNAAEDTPPGALLPPPERIATPSAQEPQRLDSDAAHASPTDCYAYDEWETGPGGPSWLAASIARLHEFSSRSSATHGRSTGLGQPLRGTSWLNRPYEFSVDTGAFLMAGNPGSGVRGANDYFVALTAGWDWDHYWGMQGRLGWTTPHLITDNGGGEPDNLFLTDLSIMYYPWGDSRIRPYWRMGMGLTDLEYTNQNGLRQQQYLFTIPFGVGIKHQSRRWLAWKLEVVDNLAIGGNGANTMNNFTLTCGMEARFGGRPGGYWAWRPRGYGW